MTSYRAQKTLVKLGRDLRDARLSRRMTIADLATRAGSSQSTIKRLEQGDGGVGLGVLAQVMSVLGGLDRLDGLMDASNDEIGQMLLAGLRPKHGRSSSGTKASPRQANRAPSPSGVVNPDGEGF